MARYVAFVISCIMLTASIFLLISGSQSSDGNNSNYSGAGAVIMLFTVIPLTQLVYEYSSMPMTSIDLSIFGKTTDQVEDERMRREKEQRSRARDAMLNLNEGLRAVTNWIAASAELRKVGGNVYRRYRRLPKLRRPREKHAAA